MSREPIPGWDDVVKALGAAVAREQQAEFGAASGSAARQPRPLRRRVWHVAAYGTMHREETKFYAVKSAGDCIASEIATEDVATLLARSPKMLDALLDIYAVATGEMQVAHDDTEGMAWIAKRIARLDLPQNAQVERPPVSAALNAKETDE